MEGERSFLTALKASRQAWDEPADWRAALALYEGAPADRTAALDHLILQMIDIHYRNPFSDHSPQPYEQSLVSLPQSMSPDDLLCIEAAVLVAAERGLGEALFRLNRLIGHPTWHLLTAHLSWLDREMLPVQRRLALTRAGRGLGAMLGMAAGDALGCTLEFMDREEVHQRYPEGHREIIGGGPFGFPPGSWTDDTAMAMGVANGIIARPEDPVDAVGDQFIAWFQSCPPDVGNTCRVALIAYQENGSWAAASQEVQRQMGDWAAGNGALMRTLPTALAYGADLTQALRIGRMTHPHPKSDVAIAIYHRLVDHLLDGRKKEEAFQATLRWAEDWARALGQGTSQSTSQGTTQGTSQGTSPAHLTDLATGLEPYDPLSLQEALLAQIASLQGLATRPAEEVQATGYVVDTLEAALWSFLRTDSLEECIVTAVNLGDDADTVGAVAGGLAGAAYGSAALPRRWSLALKERRLLEEAAEGLYQLYSSRVTRN